MWSSIFCEQAHVGALEGSVSQGETDVEPSYASSSSVRHRAKEGGTVAVCVKGEFTASRTERSMILLRSSAAVVVTTDFQEEAQHELRLSVYM